MASLKSQIQLCNRARWILLGLAGGLSLLFYFAGYRPQLSRQHDLDEKIVDASHVLSTNTAQAQGLPLVVANIQRLRAQLAYFKKLPQSLELGEFVTEITQMSHAANLQKLEYSLNGAPHRGEQYTEQAMTIKFEGDFRGVFTFLRAAEDMPRMTRVASISIHDVDLVSGMVQVDLSMNLYFSEPKDSDKG